MKSKVLVIFLFLLVVITVVSAGEMDGWAYRKQITVSNSGMDLTDYQLKFTIYRSTGTDSGFNVYISDKCQDDYDDIRFTTSDGLTLCNYWIESSDSSSATIWVKVPSLPAGNTILYLYYGNPNATAISNGDNTFIFFDDFPGSSLNTSKWTQTGGSVSISSGILTLSVSGSWTGIRSNNTYNQSAVCFVVRTKKGSIGGAPYGSFTGLSKTTTDITNVLGIYMDSTDSDRLVSVKAGTYTTTVVSPQLTDYQIIQGKWGTSTDYYENYSYVTTHTSTYTPTVSQYYVVIGYNMKIYVDYVFIHKYASTEPTVSTWGSEETALPIVTPDFSATPTSGESPLTVYFSDMSIGGTIWPIHSINIDYWEWDFGDGSPKNYQQNPAHTYTQTGYFNVTLKSGNLTYGEYNTTTKTNYINVVVSSTVPVAEFMATPTCANTGTTIYFIDYSTGGGLYAWNWSFGDGTYSTLRNPTHQYSSNGLYDISLTVWGAYGSDTETKTGYIQIPCPTPTPTPTPSPTPIPTPTGTPPIQGEIPQARIPVLGFMVLAWVDLGLILYTFIDNENRNYMHIYSAVIAVILSFLLAVSLTNGFITEAHVLTDKEVTVNSSVLSTHLVEHIAVTDTGWSWFFAFLGVMMLIISVLSAIEAVRENTEEVM